LQRKTEQDVFALLEQARAAKLAEAAAAAKAAAAGSTATSDGAVDAAVADVAEEEEDDTVDVINPETGEVSGSCFHRRLVEQICGVDASVQFMVGMGHACGVCLQPCPAADVSVC
jgi:predicted secreted protein